MAMYMPIHAIIINSWVASVAESTFKKLVLLAICFTTAITNVLYHDLVLGENITYIKGMYIHNHVKLVVNL